MEKNQDEEEIITTFSDSETDDYVYNKKEVRKIRKNNRKMEREEAERNKTKLQIVMEYVKVIIIGALIAFLLCRFVIINAVVPTGSMIPTIVEGDRMIGLRVVYYFSDPQRGDVVIFRCPDTKNLDKLYVKRVIGLPGETVEIKAGQVIITTAEGETIYLEEDYLNETPNPEAAVNNDTYVLGDDEYFMMGDNRNRSEDSRYWGNVTRDRVEAKAVFKYYKGFEVID